MYLKIYRRITSVTILLQDYYFILEYSKVEIRNTQKKDPLSRVFKSRGFAHFLRVTRQRFT